MGAKRGKEYQVIRQKAVDIIMDILQCSQVLILNLLSFLLKQCDYAPNHAVSNTGFEQLYHYKCFGYVHFVVEKCQHFLQSNNVSLKVTDK